MSITRFFKISIWFFTLGVVFGAVINLEESVPHLMEVFQPKKGFGITKLESIGLGGIHNCYLTDSTISCYQRKPVEEQRRVIFGMLQKKQIKLQFETKWYLVHVRSEKVKYSGWHSDNTPFSTSQIKEGDYMVMIADLPFDKRWSLEKLVLKRINCLSDLKDFLDPKALLQAVYFTFGDCSTDLKLFQEPRLPKIIHKPFYFDINTEVKLLPERKAYRSAHHISSGNFKPDNEASYYIIEKGQYAWITGTLNDIFLDYDICLLLSQDRIQFELNEEILNVEISEGKIYLKENKDKFQINVFVYRNKTLEFQVTANKVCLEEGDIIVATDILRPGEKLLDNMIPKDFKLNNLTRWIEVAAAFSSHHLLVLKYESEKASETPKDNHLPVAESSLPTDDVKETTVFPKTIMSSAIEKERIALLLPFGSSNGIESGSIGNSYQGTMILDAPSNLDNIDNLENRMENLNINKVNKHSKTLPKESNTNLSRVRSEILAGDNDTKKGGSPIFGSINDSGQLPKERNYKKINEFKEIPGWGVSCTFPNKRPIGLSLSWWSEREDVELDAFSSHGLIIFDSTGFAFRRSSGSNGMLIRMEGNILHYTKEGESPIQLAIVRGQKEMTITLDDLKFEIQEGDLIIIGPTKQATWQGLEPADTYAAFFEKLKHSLEDSRFDTPFVAKVLNFN